MRKEGFQYRQGILRRDLGLAAGAAALAYGASSLSSRVELTSASLPRDTETDAVARFVPDERALLLREAYRDARLWHPRTIAVFSDEVKDGTPRFLTDRARRALLERNPDTQFLSAVRFDRSANRFFSTKDTLAETKAEILARIAAAGSEPLSVVWSAHGGPSGIELGSYPNGDGSKTSVYLTPQEIGAAFAEKYRGMAARLQARETPDIVSLVNCSSGTLAEEFMSGLQQAEIDQEPRRTRWAFKPTVPISFSASTEGENAYINAMLFRMAECDTVGDMYRYAERIQSDNSVSFSNPSIRVPDVRSGEPVVVG